VPNGLAVPVAIEVQPAGVGLGVLVLLLPNAMIKSPAAVAGTEIEVMPPADTVDPNTLDTKIGTGVVSKAW
jgi:hypothetical protein